MEAVGIHTPEFEHERRREAVIEHSRQQGIHFPQLLDNDYAYWNALGNQYWPTLYLVDRCGFIRERSIGEVHRGEASGRRLDARIEELLAEVADCGDRSEPLSAGSSAGSALRARSVIRPCAKL